jgi:hypothetical protein
MPLPCLQWWPGNLSYKDFTADLAGTALAAAGLLLHHSYTAGSAAATSSALAGLASSLRPTGRQPAYRLVPTDIEMGIAPVTTATADDDD